MTLEELLNKLIEKGWKPFRWKDIKRANNEGWFVCFVHKSKKRPWLSNVSHRELVSKESNLWQFVCENGMTKKHTDLWVRCNEKTSKTYQDSYINQNYGYWLLESSLKDESELEDFLLQNIKVEGKNE